MGRISEGGFTEAAVRAGLLVSRLGRGARRLSTFKRIREAVGRDVGLLDLPAAAAADVVRRQSAIVEQAPERALAALPDLVRTAEERRRLLDILDRLADRLDLEPEQRAMLPRFHDLLAPAPEAVPAAGPAPRRRRTG